MQLSIIMNDEVEFQVMRNDEREALLAIYEDDIFILNENEYKLSFPNEVEGRENLVLTIVLPDNYPIKGDIIILSLCLNYL